MNNNDKLLNDKIEEVHAILEFLNSQFGIEYSLSHTKLSSDNRHVLLQPLIFSNTLDNDIINHFKDQINRHQQHINKIPNLIKEGLTVVKCINDSNKPHNIGDWPIKNRHYVVEDMCLANNEGLYAFRLKGMNINPPYTGYSMLRFERVIIKEMYN